jgi:DNA-binding transcriptional LysR family regulator
VEFLNYHHLRYFWVVAKEAGLRKAAEKLHVSQPTISAQIAALEGMLDEKLFQRGGRALALTETGHRVLSYAEEIFSLGQELLDAARQRPGARALRLHIGMTDSMPKLVSYEIIKPIFKLDKPIQAACRHGLGFFAVPTLVVKEAVTRYGFQSIGRTEDCRQQFYAISAERKLMHPAVLVITSQARAALSN